MDAEAMKIGQMIIGIGTALCIQYIDCIETVRFNDVLKTTSPLLFIFKIFQNSHLNEKSSR